MKKGKQSLINEVALRLKGINCEAIKHFNNMPPVPATGVYIVGYPPGRANPMKLHLCKDCAEKWAFQKFLKRAKENLNATNKDKVYDIEC